MSIGSAPPYARMVGNKFDVSAYCQQSLVDALDHLTSVKFALFALIRPALKIAARSLFVEHETITVSNILLHLNAETPIAEAPPEAQPQRPKRSLGQRLKHFFTVGIPLAILVGILAGILHFIRAVSGDIATVFNVGSRLYSMVRGDAKFYQENPQLLPPRNVAIDGVVNGALTFYTRRLVYRKLGMFSFLAKPIMWLIESVLVKRLISFFDKIDLIRRRYGARSTAPSAPPPPTTLYPDLDADKYD